MIEGSQRKKLEDLCAQITDGKHGDCVNQDGSGFYFLSCKDVSDGKLSYEDARQITEADFIDTHRRTKLEASDILITNSGTIGRMAIVPKHELTSRTTFQKSVAILKPLSGKVEPTFLYYQLLSDRDRLIAFAGGTAQKNLLLRDLRSFTVDIPPTQVQRCIADILSAYDDLIENNTRRIKILEQMAQMLYREWFVNFRFPGHEKVEMVESELELIPEGWSILAFAVLIESALGGDWGEDVPTDEEQAPVVVIRGTDFDDLRMGKPLRAPRRFITHGSLQRRKLQPGDIVVENSVNAKTRCAGSVLLITPGMLRRIGADAIAASFCRVFRPKNRKLSPLLILHMQRLHSEGGMSFYQNVAANGIANFQTTRFLETERIVLPSNADNLEARLDMLTPLMTSSPADRIHNLRTTRDLLLPKLVSGEVSVETLEEEALAETV
jgi:type I restriction enzyme S subunit